MVHQISSRNVINLEVCSISYQRHCTSLLNKRSKITNTLCKKPVMADNTDRHPLPVVELRPFSKKVWRREKSLPDFYDKRKTEEVTTSSSSNSAPEFDPPATRLIRELTETKRGIDTRQNTFDSALGKYRNHPKAEFLHESNKAWRKQDLIPSFITRFERTKTSLDALSRDSTLHKINFESPSMFENALKREPNPMIKIKGGRMNQQINRRHFLYLNPLDTYRQPNSWVPHFNSTNNSRQNTTRDKLILSSRHSIPLTSSRTRDLLLGDSQAQYPLKPIRREDAESPHKFNSKLGAAKNSLEVLSKVGIQTKLEKSLEKEMEFNMEKFRRDRLLFSNDLKGAPFQCFNVESNLTVGEMSLKTAREANRLAKSKQRQNNARRINVLGGDLRGGDIYNSYSPDVDTTRLPNSSMVNPVLHPIGHSLVEEADTYVSSDSALAASHKLVGRGRDQNQTKMNSVSKDNGLLSSDPLQSSNMNGNSIGSKDLPNSTKVQSSDDTNARGQGTAEINNNSNKVISKEGGQVIDSSRIETNVAYLQNLQLKSAQGYNASNSATPSLNLVQTARSNPVGTENIVHTPSNVDQLSPSQQSEYTSHHDQSLLQSQRVSPHSVANSPLSQQNNQQQKVDRHDNQPDDSQSQNDLQTQQQPEKTPKTDAPDQVEKEHSLSNEIKARSKSATDESPDSSRSTIPDNSELPASDGSRDKHVTQSEAAPVEESRKQPVVETNNSSPMTSSGFESQTTTDQEDELSPTSDGKEIFRSDVKGQSQDDSNSVKTADDVKNSSKSQSIEEDLSPKTSGSNDSVQTVSASDQEGKTVLENDPQNDKITADKDNVPSQMPTQSKTTAQFSPEVDEGIGLVPTEAAVLDSSVTEVCSDHGVTGCADNGDSGVSTTFLTSEDSMPEALEGVVAS